MKKKFGLKCSLTVLGYDFFKDVREGYVFLGVRGGKMCVPSMMGFLL